MAKLRYVILLLCVILVAMTTDKPAYQIFDVRGKKTTYDKMLKDISQCEVVLFGEMHDSTIS
ncbi:MAG: iron-regulated protein, partial [Bacteroidota bacterium]